MVQDQLVEYVSSQLKTGISRDAIKSALVGVGWAPLDVEDTLKKVEGGTGSGIVQQVITPKTMDVTPGTSSSPNVVSFSAPGTAAGQAKNPESQSIKVSDLVSAVAPASSMPAGGSPKIISSSPSSVGKSSVAAQDQFSKGSLGNFSVSAAPAGKKKMKMGLLLGILAVIVILAVGAFAGYLFMKNSSLNSELQTQNSQSQGLTQSSAAQLQALTASSSALEMENASVTAENQNLAANLLLLAAPSGLSSSTAPSQISLSGVLSAGLGKNTYVITTQYGVKANIKNSSDTAVASTLLPLLGTLVQVSGTYVPGTPSITVTSINGAAIVMQVATTTAPAPTPTSTTIVPPIPPRIPAVGTTTP